MKTALLRAALVGILVSAPLGAVVTPYIYTGLGNNGWYGGAVPPNDGTANIEVVNFTGYPYKLDGNFAANSFIFGHEDNTRFVPADGATPLPLTLTINGGGLIASSDFGSRIDFDQGITVNLAAAQAWQLGQQGAVTVHGKLTGTGALVVTGTNQALVLANLTGNASDHSGGITLVNDAPANSSQLPTLALWGNNSIGTGTITFTNGGAISTHLSPTIANSLVFNSGPVPVGQVAPTQIRLRSWDGATTYAGSVLLANHTTLFGVTSFKNKMGAQLPNNTGNRPLPGPIARNPNLFTGPIGDGGAGKSLNVIGPGLIILAGNNTYSGGTNVGFPASQTFNSGGSLIFATQAAIPATGNLQAGLPNLGNAAGYMGIATNAVGTAGDFNTFLDRIAADSSGAVGVDSLTLSHLPSATPFTFSDNINLKLFNTTAASGIRLSTATSVILTGNITPQHDTAYHFGNGGGKLYVQSSLVNQDAITSVQTSNSGSALMLYLIGNNSYTGGTHANSGFVIFDGASAVPASGSFRAGGSQTSVGNSYIGFTDAVFGTNEISSANGTLISLLGRFDKANTWGVLGFDTHIDPSTGAMGTPLSINQLDLTGFNDGVFVGTTSAALLHGTITPTTVTNGNNSANALRFTAGNGGVLTVDSTLADPGPALSVIIGTPSGQFQSMSDGTVQLNGVNTYTGGTSINGAGFITVAVGNNSALGTGPITLNAQGGGVVGLSASAPGITLSNPINFAQAAPMQGGTPELMLVGPNDFTLAGNISGPPANNEFVSGVGAITLSNPTPRNVTLSGDNSNFHGYFNVRNGTLTFASDNAAGNGSLYFHDSSATMNFTSMNPSIRGGISADNGGNLHLANGATLTIDTTRDNRDFDFGGNISAPGGGATSAALVVTAAPDSEFLYLYGNNNYTGGTTISGSGALAVGSNNAAGSGLITINSVDGGLATNQGVRLTNPIHLIAGGLAGMGTFAPTTFNGVLGGQFIIGTNQVVLPGFPDEDITPGKLVLEGSAIFNPGGMLMLGIHDPNVLDGHSHLHITGNLDLSNLTSLSFLIGLENTDPDNEDGMNPYIVYGQSYSIPILSTGGFITGFNPAAFAFDLTDLQNGTLDPSLFNVTSDGSTISLNFTAVPEPSTYALILTGLGLVGLALRRRRV